MPVQLPRIPCKICKMLFGPTNSSHKMYCGDKCTNAAGNARKRMRREGIRKNIEILKSLQIPLNDSIPFPKDDIESRGFDIEYYTDILEIWSEEHRAFTNRVYFDKFVVCNQKEELRIFHF